MTKVLKITSELAKTETEKLMLCEILRLAREAGYGRVHDSVDDNFLMSYSIDQAIDIFIMPFTTP